MAFLGAAHARGDRAILYLRGPALGAFVAGGGFVASDHGPDFGGVTPGRLLVDLRIGGVRVYACPAWALAQGVSPDRVATCVDAQVGLVGFLAQADGGTILYL